MKPKPQLIYMVLCQDAGYKESRLMNVYGVLTSVLITLKEAGKVQAVVQFNVAISIWITDDTTPHKISLRVQHPDGSENDLFLSEISKPKTHSVGSGIVPIALTVYGAGVHWIKLYLDDELSHQHPLEVEVRVDPLAYNEVQWPEHL